MDAYQLQGHSLDSLRRIDLPEPQPGPGQVRIRVAAASVNYRDYALATGRYQPELPRPFIPLSDGVGRIEAVGDGVEGYAPGDRVLGHYTTGWIDGPFKSENHLSKLGGPLDGWLARQIVLPAGAILPAPEAQRHRPFRCPASPPGARCSAWTCSPAPAYSCKAPAACP